MEVDNPFNVANGANVVDPEVRAFVYSLVTAVCLNFPLLTSNKEIDS